MTLIRPRTLGLVVLTLGLAAVQVASMLAPSGASSHREAPLITEDPVADNTDTYLFVSPADPDNVVIVANYIPLQDPAGGPNFYNFGNDVLYAMHVDNDGDAVADQTYEFTFTTTLTNPETFLYATGPIESLDDPDWNIRQTYTVSQVVDGVRTVLGQNLPVPPNNIGARTTPDYAALADEAINDLPGGITAFAGQREDPFWVDLGSIFDLGALRPFNSLHLIPGVDGPGVDAVAGKNVHSIVLEVPADTLSPSGEDVIGAWATASRRKTRVFAGGSSAAPEHSGPFLQVSRLGNPLVNEVVIPLALKDAFNTLRPDQDAATLAGLEIGGSTEGDIPIVTDPELAELLPVLYPGVFGEGGIADLPPVPRDDLVTIFLTGIPDINQFGGEFQPAEYLRLNTAIPPAGPSILDGERLGMLADPPDAAGFPNGRRLIDDVVDIALQAVAGATPLTPDFDVAPNNQLSQGVPFNDVPFLDVFPYVAHPFPGYAG